MQIIREKKNNTTEFTTFNFAKRKFMNDGKSNLIIINLSIAKYTMSNKPINKIKFQMISNLH